MGAEKAGTSRWIRLIQDHPDVHQLSQAGELHFGGHVDDQHAIDPGIGRPGFREQRYCEQAVGIAIRDDLLAQAFAHARMHDGFEPAPRRVVAEHEAAHGSAIECAVIIKNIGAKGCNDCLQP